MNKIYRIFAILVLLITSVGSFAQTVPVGVIGNVEDVLRRQQLLGNDTSGSSFMIRPLNMSMFQDLVLDEALQFTGGQLRKQLYTSANGKASFFALPVTLNQQYNTHNPYGLNDGSMIPARGYQTQFTAGIFGKVGPLSIQLMPDFVYAQNKGFRQLHETGDLNGKPFIDSYISFYSNRIDAPERFGTKAYSRAGWGQSSIRLTFDPVSFGLSNENLWWGPGVKNSLLMSNNAGGFKHLTLNTTKPIRTYIGKFESQIIAGRLEPSNIDVENPAFQAKPDDWRYISGIIITYQPKWIPGLYLGLDRTYVTNHEDLGNGFYDYFPIFSALEKRAYATEITTGPDAEDKKRRDQYASIFARWLLPASHSEVYLQYGRNDHAYDTRDLTIQPEHGRAYVAGFRTLVPFKGDDEFIQVGIELTQMENTRTSNLRAAPVWYVHPQVTAGYTSEGQVIGAGVGPGSNLQSINVDWVKGIKRIGIQVERLTHNNDLFYKSVKGIRQNWVDVSAAAKFDWTFNHFLLNSQLTYIRSLNYQYTLIEGADFWHWNKQDVNNIQMKIGLAYLF